MPTGYTADIAKGITFPQFVWNCARAFGALITMRDEPASAPVPEQFEPDTYHRQQLRLDEAEIDRLRALTVEQAEQAAADEFEAESASVAKRLGEYRDLRAKYEEMIAAVSAWVPPTTEHQGLRTFMLEQLAQSLDFDCNEKYLTAPVRLSGKSWLRAKLAAAIKSIEHHEKGNREERERIATRNRWIADLRTSVPPPSQSTSA